MAHIIGRQRKPMVILASPLNQHASLTILLFLIMDGRLIARRIRQLFDWSTHRLIIEFVERFNGRPWSRTRVLSETHVGSEVNRRLTLVVVVSQWYEKSRNNQIIMQQIPLIIIDLWWIERNKLQSIINVMDYNQFHDYKSIIIVAC